MKNLQKILNKQRGDTIVEVMLALAVIGLTLGISFAIANRSTNIGLESRERSAALKLAESQFEYMKNNLTNIATYRDTTPYCIVNGAKVTGAACQGVNTLFNLSVVYTAPTAGNPEVFESIVTWEKLSSEGNNQVSLVYRP